jgi:hypothetical protein
MTKTAPRRCFLVSTRCLEFHEASTTFLTSSIPASTPFRSRFSTDANPRTSASHRRPGITPAVPRSYADINARCGDSYASSENSFCVNPNCSRRNLSPVADRSTFLNTNPRRAFNNNFRTPSTCRTSAPRIFLQCSSRRSRTITPLNLQHRTLREQRYQSATGPRRECFSSARPEPSRQANAKFVE